MNMAHMGCKKQLAVLEGSGSGVVERSRAPSAEFYCK